MKKYLLLFIVFVNFSVTAQTLSGNIVDSENRPVEYANIRLFHFSDSTFIAGCVSNENGYFCFENGAGEKQILEISCLGFISQRLIIEKSTSSQIVGNIVLKPVENQLQEITVTAHTLPFSRKGDKLIANVESSLLSSIGTARDILQQFPGVIFKKNEINVFGKGSPLIYINNRKVYDLNELQRLKSADIATIELNLTPGAEYDAEGRALLLIKTKHNKTNGWATQLSEAITYGHYLNNQASIGLNYRHDNLYLFASYEHLFARQDRNPYASYTIQEDTLWQLIFDMPQIYRDAYHQMTTGMEWNVGSQHTIGGQYQGIFNQNRVQSNGQNAVWANEALYDNLSIALQSEDTPHLHISNFFYDGKWNELLLLHLDLDYVTKNNRMNQTVNEISKSDVRDVNLRSQSDFSMYAGRLTLKYDIGQAGNVVLGGESNLIKGSGFLFNPEQYIESTSYARQEEKTAGFISYNNSFNKYHLQMGVRYEHTYEKFTDNHSNQLIINRQYHNFYPDISFSRISDTEQMGLSVSRKIKRPTFAQLNNNNFYVNQWILQKGNPFLKNETIIELDAYWKYKFLDITCGYVYKKNPISLGFESSDRLMIMNYINFPKYQEINAMIVGTFPCKFINIQANIGIQKPFFELYSMGRTLYRNKMSLLLGCSNTVTLPLKYIFSVDFNYQGKSNYYAIEYGQYANIDLSIRKLFWDDKLSVQLQVTDCFKWIKDHTVITMNNIVYDQRSIFETRYVKLTVNYRFNNYNKNYKGQNAAGKDINRL
jgi:hypothetical protein